MRANRRPARGRPIRRELTGDLGEQLRSLEGAPYPAYRDLKGRHRLPEGDLEILHVQADPFAPPSRLEITVPLDRAGLQAGIDTPTGRLAAEDFFARRIEAWLRARPDLGRTLRIDPSSQQILRRTAVTLEGERVVVRLTASMPARGRRIEGRRAARVLAEGIPLLLRETLLDRVWDAGALAAHRRCLEDYLALRCLLARNGWVAFVADGSRLARRSGEEDTPMEEGNVPFVAPPEMAAEVELPHAGRIRGTAIPRGITLLCGGGFHGKSTLLRALAAAVHPHIPGDGRERVAGEPTALAVRAEDGRAITSVDLRPFLRSLPSGHDLARFTTGNASGSTSQAAAILEAIGAGSRCLLIDEDTSATNFLLRDPWMAKLLDEDREPIVPLLARLREIHERFGVSTILVVGGSGEAFRIADRALMMNAYRPEDATARMESIRAAMGEGTTADPTDWPPPARRVPLDRLRRSDPRVKAVGARKLLVGRSEVDLGASGALVHPSQARTLATILSSVLARRGPQEELPALAEWAADRIEREGAGTFSPFRRGDLAEVRAQEIAMLFNRLRYGAARERGQRSGTEEASGG